MTGGYAGNSYDPTKTVEVLKTDGTAWCTLPDLPDDRSTHTQSGLLACGGWPQPTTNNCVKFTDGHWNISHEDLDYQYEHCAWSSSKHGTRLIHGDWSQLLVDKGETPDRFRLEYYTV